MTQEMRLEGVINHVLRRRILRIERQLIPKALRSSDAPSERTVIDESVSTFGQRQEAAPPAAAASFLHRWQQGYGGRQMLAIPEMPGVAGRGFHYQDGALLSEQQMTCWPAGQEEGLGTSSEARSGLAGTTTQENDLTAAVAGLLGALSSQESEGSRASHRHPATPGIAVTAAVAGLLGALDRSEGSRASHRHPAINGISKQNQHPSHWMPVVAGRHLQPGGAGLSGQQMHSWPAGGSAPSCSSGDTAGGGASEAAGQVRSATCCCSATCPRNKVLSASSPCALQVGLGISSEAPSRTAEELECAALLSLLAQHLDSTAAVAGRAGATALSEGSILGKRGSVDSMQQRWLLSKALRRRGQDEQARQPPGGEASANVTVKDADDSMPPELEGLEGAASPPASALGDRMLPGSRQAARLEALLLAKREHDAALDVIEQCVAIGVLSRSEEVAQRAEAADTLQRAKDLAGLGSAERGAKRDMQANSFMSSGHCMVAGGSAQGPKSYSQHLQSVVAGGVTVQQRKHSRTASSLMASSGVLPHTGAALGGLVSGIAPPGAPVIYKPESAAERREDGGKGDSAGKGEGQSWAPGWLKNTQDFCINDDLSEDTLEALGRELGLAVSGREELLELLAVIHKASGAT